MRVAPPGDAGARRWCVWRWPRRVVARSGGHATGAQHAGRASDSVAGRAARAYRRREGVEVTRYNLPSARGRKLCQAASVRGLSNKELKLHLAVGSGVRGRGSVAARRSLTPTALD